MRDFLQAISERISVSYKQLSILRNPDGFLKVRSVQQAIEKEYNICFVTGSNIELRCHFERIFKRDNSTKYCYTQIDSTELLPDMLEQAYSCRFNVIDLFSNFVDKQVLKCLDYPALKYLYETNTAGIVSSLDAKIRIVEFQKFTTLVKKPSAEDYIEKIGNLVSGCTDIVLPIRSLADVLSEAISDGYYEQLRPSISSINSRFQDSLFRMYGEAISSNPLLSVRAVNKVLPHIDANFSKDNKVALIVVDGMSYWQYAVLKRHIKEVGIEAVDNPIFSWMPSITMLSRQSIFRGAAPQQDYKQNPSNEAKLWREHWISFGVNPSDIQYIYDGDELEIFSTTKRLAVVTVDLDEKMHASSDNDDLMALTENWAKRFLPVIRKIKEAEFSILLTTDHGNIHARGLRNLTAQEKTFLYKDGSRGTRHLIYENLQEMAEFAASNTDAGLQMHQNWLAFSNEYCFAKAGTEVITHGGTHFLEVLVPFVKI